MVGFLQEKLVRNLEFPNAGQILSSRQEKGAKKVLGKVNSQLPTQTRAVQLLGCESALSRACPGPRFVLFLALLMS